MKDNHIGHKFEQVKLQFPGATRFHWHQNAFKPSDCYWMVGTPNICGGGAGVTWVDIRLDQII